MDKINPIEESLIEPFRFAKQLAKARNSDGLHEVKVARIEVFRGIPIPDDDPEGYRRNLEQKSQWEYGHQGMVSVTLRPLKYNWEWYDPSDRRTFGNIKTDARIWTTSMKRDHFTASLDPREYL